MRYPSGKSTVPPRSMLARTKRIRIFRVIYLNDIRGKIQHLGINDKPLRFRRNAKCDRQPAKFKSFPKGNAELGDSYTTDASSGGQKFFRVGQLSPRNPIHRIRITFRAT